jgi:hypothetical protein
VCRKAVYFPLGGGGRRSTPDRRRRYDLKEYTDLFFGLKQHVKVQNWLWISHSRQGAPGHRPSWCVHLHIIKNCSNYTCEFLTQTVCRYSGQSPFGRAGDRLPTDAAGMTSRYKPFLFFCLKQHVKVKNWVAIHLEPESMFYEQDNGVATPGSW